MHDPVPSLGCIVGNAWHRHTWGCHRCCCVQEYGLMVYAVGRKKGQPCKWQLEEHLLLASSLEQVKDWAAIVHSSVNMCHDR